MNEKTEPKYYIQFDGNGNLLESKGINGVLKLGTGDYIINPSEEDYHKKWMKDHPKISLWDKLKSWFRGRIK